jgi:hypothetical protein
VGGELGVGSRMILVKFKVIRVNGKSGEALEPELRTTIV